VYIRDHHNRYICWRTCRAFLKAPALLLFDEATSALDSSTEAQILEALGALAQVGGWVRNSLVVIVLKVQGFRRNHRDGWAGGREPSEIRREPGTVLDIVLQQAAKASPMFWNLSCGQSCSTLAFATIQLATSIQHI
jgi:hypothetical protein